MKKTLNISFISSTLLLVIIVFLLSCHNKKDNSPQPTQSQTGEFLFHLHTNIDTNEINVYNMILPTGTGRNMSLSLAQLYLSEIELVKADGSVYPIKDSVVLKVIQNEVYDLGKVPTGNYTSVRFMVGLNDTVNKKLYSTGDGALGDSSMWFGTSGQQNGYIFLNVEGKIDTTISGTGPYKEMQPFVYKIGTSGHSVEIKMPYKNFSVLPNQAEYIHITIDYAKILKGIDLKTPGNLTIQSVNDNSKPVATQIVQNIPDMFRYEQ